MKDSTMLHEVWGGSDACQGTRHKVECGPCCRRCDGPSIFCIRSMQSITHLFPRSVPPSLLFFFVPEASSASAGPLDLSTIRGIYRVFSKHYAFFLKTLWFSELCQFCCSAGVLPAWCVYTHTDTEGKRRKTRGQNILKSLKKTQYLMNTLYKHVTMTISVISILDPPANIIFQIFTSATPEPCLFVGMLFCVSVHIFGRNCTCVRWRKVSYCPMFPDWNKKS